MKCELTVNGRRLEVDVAADEPLATTLRDGAGLSSVRTTCGLGLCGTCTVMVDGEVISSCLMLSHQAVGRSITTSEGLRRDGLLSRVQQAFVNQGAYQCAYCIPGFVVTVEACLRHHPNATVDEVREYLSGNLCRCGSYAAILDAIREIVADRPSDPTTRQPNPEEQP